MKLDSHGQFVTLQGKDLGIYASKTRAGRWQYKNEAGQVIASGMAPAVFVKRYWYRDDFYTPTPPRPAEPRG